MKKFEGMLFCTDLDGTLVSDDETISKENLDAIEYFKSEGGYFTFVTGRVPISAEPICDTVKPNAPYGCFNGGAVFDPTENRYLWHLSLSEEAYELIYAVDRQLPEIGIQLNTEKDIHCCKDSLAMNRFREVTGLPLIPCHYSEISEPIIKVVFTIDREELFKPLQNLLYNHPAAKNFDFIRSELTLYEILPKGVSKGLALSKMAELLNIDMKKTVAAGDYDNDIEMVKTAGHGFAVSNAVAGVKAVADHITVSNNEHAIAEIIYGFDCGKYKI